MVTALEVEKLALELPEFDREQLASKLLASLPAEFGYEDDDEVIAEALRRDAEMDKDPSMGISLEELDKMIERRHS